VNNRIRTTLAVLTATVVAAVGVAPAAAATDEYVPFVTDFPKPAERYVPFVSDFPEPVSPAPAPQPVADGIDWAVPAQATVVALAALLTLAALAAARRRHHPDPRLGDC
jgi:MYXO-CTERM domain-containing protein